MRVIFLILFNVVVLNAYAAAVRPTMDFATLVDFTSKEMGIETNESKPLPQLTFESEITLKEFQREVLPQWGFNPDQISNIYVLKSNRIIVIDDSDYYRRLHRVVDDSIVHELVHYFQVQYRGYTLGDLDDNAEMDAVYYQTLFRERYFPQFATGYYSNGRLENGVNLLEADAKDKIHKLFLPRGRFYGTKELVSLIDQTARFVENNFPDHGKVQVGDLSLKNGGLAQGHLSHQNGLDVDFVYLAHKNSLQNPNADFWEEEFVNRGVVSQNFDLEKNWSLFKFLITELSVQRIFVDIKIKELLCTRADGLNDLEVLRRIRFADHHTNHFHVRLPCPSDNSACTPQEEPKNSGCEESIQMNNQMDALSLHH